MKRPRVMPAMSRDRASRFSKDVSPIADWDISHGPDIFGEASGQNLGKRIDITLSDGKKRVTVRLAAADVYELHEDLGRAFDEALGI